MSLVDTPKAPWIRMYDAKEPRPDDVPARRVVSSCERCGTMQTYRLPLDLGLWSDMTTAFMRLHRRCEEASEWPELTVKTEPQANLARDLFPSVRVTG